MATPQLTDTMAADAFRAAAEAKAAERASQRGTRSKWTPEIDAEILRANVELGLGSRPIAEIMLATYGWGCRSAVEERLSYLRAAKK